MTYSVKEIFYTLQGEGVNAGRPAVFCRFSGCNLWSGREFDRATAVCTFCDTDFVGTDGTFGRKYSKPDELAEQIDSIWPAGGPNKLVVITGGEPMLQIDVPLLQALHEVGFEVAVETNGTIPAPDGIDWLCVSPKTGANWVQRQGSELKLVYPQVGLMPDDVGGDFKHFLLQPLDGPDVSLHTKQAIEHCQRDPRWRLSLQTHKVLAIR